MTTYCDYCYGIDHQRWNCPSQRAIEADADDASLEELEAAEEILDRHTADNCSSPESCSYPFTGVRT